MALALTPHRAEFTLRNQIHTIGSDAPPSSSGGRDGRDGGHGGHGGRGGDGRGGVVVDPDLPPEVAAAMAKVGFQITQITLITQITTSPDQSVLLLPTSLWLVSQLREISPTSSSSHPPWLLHPDPCPCWLQAASAAAAGAGGGGGGGDNQLISVLDEEGGEGGHHGRCLSLFSYAFACMQQFGLKVVGAVP